MTGLHRAAYFMTTAVRQMLAAAGLALLPLAAGAAGAIRVCSTDVAHPPFLFTDRDGTVQVLIKMAAAKVGVTVDVLQRPPERCRQQLMLGQVDAAAVLAFTAQSRKLAEFPLRGDEANADMAVGATRAMVFRRTGTDVRWNGEHFDNLRQPVLVPTGVAFITHRLSVLNVPFDERGRDTEQNLLKLIAGRGDAAILPENDGKALLAAPAFAGKVEMLDAPFVVQNFYMAFSKQYYAEHRQTVEALWKEIGVVRKSHAFQNAIKDIR